MEKLLFLLVVFFTNIMQAITGFAGTMLAMPAGMLLVGVNEAKAILNVMGLAACLMLVVKDFKGVSRRELGKVVVLMGVGMAIGLVILQFAQMQALLLVYAVFIIGVALKKLFIPKPFPFPAWMNRVIVILAGIIHSLFVSGGALLVVYAVTVLPDKRSFRSTMAAIWVILNSILMVSHIRSGSFTPQVVQLTLTSLVPLFIAVVIGNRLYHKVSQRLFLKITYILLLLSGVMLL